MFEDLSESEEIINREPAKSLNIETLEDVNYLESLSKFESFVDEDQPQCKRSKIH